ncbi:MAG TPA: STAS domain-containing protein [Pyrinomonadaceae bacterium]|nr:STAS domain-containing protein [Pyrinomonadaceae bacterium]
MPTNITETVQAETGKIMLRVEGDLLLEDALLLERIANSIVNERLENVVIDLADLDFLDSESAAVLKRLVASDGIELNGIEIFLQSAIDLAERGA